MKYPTIKIEGSILSSDILEKIEQGDIPGQNPKDFGFDSNTKVKDEIAIAWADAQSYWKIYKRKIDRLKEKDSGASETRQTWIVPFLGLLGYQIEKANAEIINEKTYAISHRATNYDGFPIHIMGCNEFLDKKPESGMLRMSPHALVQEYLNLTEHLNAIVTNGYQLRILRDASRLVKLSYLEFNLEQMFEEEHYSDFALMYRLIHSSRMAKKMGAGAESIFERYHQDALESGSRIREGLSLAVANSIKMFADGFMNNPANQALRDSIDNNTMDSSKLYQIMLRLIYRILFLTVIEERNLIYPRNHDKQKRETYYNYYSIAKLRKLCEIRYVHDPHFNDLWINLKQIFKLFEDEKFGAPLDILPLNGDLFGYNALDIINECELDNKILLTCIRNLSLFTNKNGTMQRVNYASLNVEEFGSVYEGLLEFAPQILKNGTYNFVFAKGDERSKTGSHYTPDELVKPLIKHSLDYIIEERVKSLELKVKSLKLKINSLELKVKDLDSKVKDIKFNANKENNYQLSTLYSQLSEAINSQLLTIKVCDVACGSGHILLSAARRLAHEVAKARTGEDQPSPEAFREAIRDVIRNCIYGVDKNPLAVELCKVSLWLEAHNPGEPLSFLDHKIKCGDSIVGLAHREELEKGIADEAFKRMPNDDKEIASLFSKKNKDEKKALAQSIVSFDFEEEFGESLNERAKQMREFNNMPEHTPKQITAKKKRFEELNADKEWWRLKTLADIQTAQFFIPKTQVNKDYLITEAEYREYLSGEKPFDARKSGKALAVSQEKRFFHWFLEFPEVFVVNSLELKVNSSNPQSSTINSQPSTNSGFDCILGNPPFLGGQKLTGSFGTEYLEYLKLEYAPIGSCDLVTYFFRRIFSIVKENGFQSLISTNTIAQGGAREGGLDVIQSLGGSINFAVRSMKWPGLAAVEVSLLAIHKGNWKKEFFLDNKRVKYISTYLDDAKTIGNPYTLKQNEGKSFQGSIVLGMGFILEPWKAEELIKRNPKNKDVLFPYLNGEDLNSNPDQSPSRWVINFFDWEEDYCRINYPDCFEIVERLVKPERMKMKGDRGAEYWWQFLRMRAELYRTIYGMERVMVVAQTSRTLAFNFSYKRKVFDAKLILFAFDRYLYFTFLQSNFHHHWAWKYCTTMKTDLSYTNTAIFEPFPFPQNIIKEQDQKLESIGEKYHEHRKQLMLNLQLGLTKTYNQFHNRELRVESEELRVENEELRVKSEKNQNNYQLSTINFKLIGKETANLVRHFGKGEPTISFDEAVAGIIKLRELHVEMDNAVLEAYGWTDIDLRHDFYEVEYLPENDRIRFTIHPDARKEILKRLLELNHKIHEEEVAAGLWDKKKSKAKKKRIEKRDNAEKIFE